MSLMQTISIHAPARGATSLTRSDFSTASISIHAPARGATLRKRRDPGLCSDFNPRSREGSDFKRLHEYRYYEISIHAPARGATLQGITLISIKKFQSTLPRGERLSRISHNIVDYVFQSTLPRGERLYDILIPLFPTDFNPRSREGSDDAQITSFFNWM